MPFGFIVNDVILNQEIASHTVDPVLTALILGFALRLAATPQKLRDSQVYFDFAHDNLLGRLWSDARGDLFTNAVCLCLLARRFSLANEHRKGITLYHMAAICARRYLQLYPGDPHASPQIKVQLETCNCISWLVASLNLLPALGLDCESESLVEYRPKYEILFLSRWLLFASADLSHPSVSCFVQHSPAFA